MEILIIFILVLINGLFSMSEIALVSARKIKLETAAKRGDKRAKIALETAQSPNRFLSTVQIGITLIGILTGVFSGEKMTADLEAWLLSYSISEIWAERLAFVMVVVFITYLSLVFGELVPKRVGLINPEGIAKAVAGPMKVISTITGPFVWLLTFSSDLLIRLFRIKPSAESRVTEEEIKAIIQEGTDVGEIQDIEQDIVERVFNLGDRNVASLMTHRNDTIVFKQSDTMEHIRPLVESEMHSFYPIASNNSEQIIGSISLKTIFSQHHNPQFSIEKHMDQPLYFTEGMSAYDALIVFKKENKHNAIVVDEFGHMQGVVTLSDLLESLVGDVSEFHGDEFTFIQREDGTWLIDGQYPLAEFLSRFEMEDYIQELPFNTVAGLILHQLRSIPKAGQKVQWLNFEFEIVDMDYVRIDKVILRELNT